jgi:hypothetical protein
VLHHYVKVVVGDKILNDSYSALVIHFLEGHCLIDLHHDACFELWTTLLVIPELLDEQEGLRVLVFGDVSFNSGEQFLDGIGL